MSNKKSAPQMPESFQSADQQGRLMMAEFVCELREANDPNLELKEQVIREALDRLSVHGLEDFDTEVEAMMASRREERG